MKKIGYMPLNGGIMGQATGPQKTGCNRSTTCLFDFQQTRQLATGLITIDCNWQLQSSCDQLWSSPVASLCTSCQLDFETLDAFGFIDPDLVVRGIHIIPAFAFGYTEELLGPSQARCQKDNMKDADWKYHYVNMYVILQLLSMYR